MVTMIKEKKIFSLNKLILTIIILVIIISIGVLDVFAAPLLQEGPIYIVQQGDTLNDIALRFGISSDEILSVNDIADPNSLFIGQRLIIPGLEGISGILTTDVLPFGVTLTNLTRQYEKNQADLVALNRLTSPSETIAGIRFTIPINEDQNPLKPMTSLVPGETALEAAIRADVSPWMLVENNQLTASWDVLPGETLFGEEVAESSLTNIPGITDISINSLPILQGETLQISVLVSEPVTLSGVFNNEPLNFFSEDAEEYYSFYGVHALVEPGVYPLQISAEKPNGTMINIEQLVLLSNVNYGFETVFITEDPDIYLNETVIANEDLYLNSFLDSVTPDRHWQGQFLYPVDEPAISNPFGRDRDYNNGKLYYYHSGLDFAIQTASNWNIYAPAAGEIVLAEELTIRGNTVLIDHGWGVYSLYVHLREVNVEVGDFVQPGDLLGLIGNTGRSVGPHLHFEIILHGTPVNPLTWLTQEFP